MHSLFISTNPEQGSYKNIMTQYLYTKHNTTSICMHASIPVYNQIKTYWYLLSETCSLSCSKQPNVLGSIWCFESLLEGIKHNSVEIIDHKVNLKLIWITTTQDHECLQMDLCQKISGHFNTLSTVEFVLQFSWEWIWWILLIWGRHHRLVIYSTLSTIIL